MPAGSPGAGVALAGVDMFRVGMALALCLVLAVVAIVIIRRAQGNSSTWRQQTRARRISVVDSIRLNPRATLHLVQCDQRVILLAADAGGVKLLDAHDRPVGEPQDAA
jgi:flagellar protein FliO/FliZ